MDGEVRFFKTLQENFSAQSEKSLRWRGSCSKFYRASSMPLDRSTNAAPSSRKDRLSRTLKGGCGGGGGGGGKDHSQGPHGDHHRPSTDFSRINRLISAGRTLSDSLERLVDDKSREEGEVEPFYDPVPAAKRSPTNSKWFKRSKSKDRMASARLINLREISSSAPLIEIVEGTTTTTKPASASAAAKDPKRPTMTSASSSSHDVIPTTPDIRVHVASDSEDDVTTTSQKDRRRAGGGGAGGGGGQQLPLSPERLRDALRVSEEDRRRRMIMDESLPLMDEKEHSSGQQQQWTGAAAAAVAPSTSPTNYLREQITSIFQVSDNKLALKLFGNKNALMREKMRQKAVGNCVIHPCSTFRLYWDLCMLVLLVANLIILPVGISFFYDDNSPPWIIFNSISDTIFLLDLLINFRTGIIKDNYADEIILDPKQIARHYLRTWFVLDLISSLPLDYLTRVLSPAMEGSVTQLLHAGRALKMFRLVKLLSLLRLLRLSRLVRYVSQWEEFISSAAGKFMRIFNLICMILLLGHWNGCLQFLVPMLQDFPSDSWVSIEELKDADWSEQYTWALFKALSHMLSIGFGRYAPQSTTDVWLTMISMLTGATCYALFVGHTTTLIQSFDTSRRLYNDKLKQVEEYMMNRKLPRQLRQRIANYYEHRYQGKMFDEESILGELNDCLREEIVNFNCRSLVSSVPFFTRAGDSSFVSEVVRNLKYEVFQPGDVIIREGSVGDKMYFIQEGVVDIIAKDGTLKTSLGDGAYFGEICLLMKTKRVASVRALSYCNLFSLSVVHLQSVLARYPGIRSTMETVAMERLRELDSYSKVEEI